MKDEWELVRIRVEKGASITLSGMPFQLPAVPASYHGGALRDAPVAARGLGGEPVRATRKGGVIATHA